jgi:biotin carboxylase
LANDDHTAWAYAHAAQRLASHFALASAPAEALETVLDKVRLGEAAMAAGIPSPRTWQADEFQANARQAVFPVLLKRRSQVGARGQNKGMVIEGPADFPARLARFARGNTYDEMVASEWPAIARPIVQEYLGAGPVYSITGFIAPGGDVVASRASRKVLQWPPSAGLGICFEDASVDPGLLERLRRMCETVGYFGTFEAEFASRGQEPVLLDFNPRVYGQMAFDVARGMDVPLLIYATATGDDRLLGKAAAAAARTRETPLVYCDRPRLEFVLRGPGAARREWWRAWLSDHRGRVVSPAADWRDPGPCVSAVVANATALAAWRVRRH